MDTKNLLNQVLNSPKMVSDKLPWNSWNSCIEDSENSIADWVGKLFQIGAFAFLIAILATVLNPFWDDGFFGGFDGNDAEETIGMLLGMVLWVYAAFPISEVIKNVGSSISDSKSNIINFIFYEVILAIIKTCGYLLAMVGLFTAIGGLIGFITTLDILSYTSPEGLAAGANLGIAALVGLIEAIPGVDLPGAAASLIEGLSGAAMVPEFGEAWTMEGAQSVFGGFIAVLVILILLYINLIIYKFVYGLLTTLVNWVKSPYIPFKSL